jgi:hypothetical protein
MVVEMEQEGAGYRVMGAVVDGQVGTAGFACL